MLQKERLKQILEIKDWASLKCGSKHCVKDICPLNYKITRNEYSWEKEFNLIRSKHTNLRGIPEFGVIFDDSSF